MKESPQLKKAEENMKPGVITLDGFLGTDRRPLVDILIEDEAEVQRLKVSHKLIAARMAHFFEAGKAGLGEFTSVDPHFEVQVSSVRGKLPCPFGDPGLIPKTNVVVRNQRLNRTITYTEFHIHLVADHGFYEGKGATFRLDPRDLVETLEVEEESGQ